MELVVVGYGNMAKAILGGLLKQSKDVLGITKIVIRILGCKYHSDISQRIFT